MKQLAITAGFLLLVLACLPMLALDGALPDKPVPSAADSTPPESGAVPGNVSLQPESQSPALVKDTGINSFRVYDEATGKVLEVSDREFLYAAVVCEMPLSFETEALKAQTVACHTFYANKRLTAREKPDEDLKGGDFAVNTEKWSIYTTKEQMQKKWGSKYEEYYQKIKSIVDQVADVIMKYEGKPIAAYFHDQSGGKTEDAVNVWGAALPYLAPVDSPGDELAPNFRSETSFPVEDFKEILTRNIKGIQLGDDPQKWVGKLTKSPSGTVLLCPVGDHMASGAEMRGFFSLRSAVFDVKLTDGRFVFSVRGHGHGVGMSQWGAQGMAQQGADYKKILNWYYKAVEIA